MKITFKTGGLLSDLLPAGSRDDEAVIEIADTATPVDVMHQLGLPEDDFYLVILNDEVVPVAERSATGLKPGDELGIYPPLKGG